MEVDDATEFTELLDAVRVSVRGGSLGCVDVEGPRAGVREVDSTDLLLICFFEVDTGIMEAGVPGSRDLPGVWNACAVDLNLTGEEGLDLACELAVGRANPIDFRGFGVTGADEDAKKLKPQHQVMPIDQSRIFIPGFALSFPSFSFSKFPVSPLSPFG